MSSTIVLSEVTLEQLDGVGLRPTVDQGNFELRGHLFTGCSSDQNVIVSIPQQRGTVEAFRYLGLNTTSATFLAGRLHNMKRTFPDMDPDMQVVMDGHFKGHSAIAIHERDDWVGAFDELGTSKRHRGSIMRPDFIDIPLTKSAAGWARFIAEEDLYALCSIDKTIQVNLSAQVRKRPARSRNITSSAE